MEILIIAVAVVVFASLIGICLLVAEKCGLHCELDGDFVCLSEKNFHTSLEELGLQMRKIEKGGRFGARENLPILEKAYKIIVKNIACGRGLTEAEKWFYENFYHLERAINLFDIGVFDGLPACGGKVRIIEVAKRVVGFSAGNFDIDRIICGIKAFNATSCICLSEVKTLKEALFFAVAEQSVALAEKIIEFRRLERLGLRGLRYKKYSDNDIYLHYFFKSSVSMGSDLAEDIGIDKKKIERNFNAFVSRIADDAKCIFNGIRMLEEEYSEERIIEEIYAPIVQILNCAEGFSDSDYRTRLDVMSGVASIAESQNISEVVVAKRAVVFSQSQRIFIGDALRDCKSQVVDFIRWGKSSVVNSRAKIRKEYAYIFSILALALGMELGLIFIVKNISISLLMFAPILCISEKIVNLALDVVVVPKVIYSLDVKKLPKGMIVSIVVSEYITSLDDAKKAVKNLDIVHAGNKNPMFTVALLVDFKASESSIADIDESIISHLAREIAARDDYAAIYIRKRSKIGKKYVGWERKRGAMMDLAEALISGDFGKFTMVGGKRAKLNPNYIISLDADNALPVGGAEELVATMAHPANLSLDMIALHGRYNLFSLKTPYSKKFLNESGMVVYPCYTGLYASLFGVDIYTGKGIFRPETFYSKLKSAFPDGKILSHDLIEGAILNTGAGGVVYEDAPISLHSEFERNNRWKRGDLLLLPYAFGWLKNAKGEKPDFSIQPIYKWLFFKNFIAILAPIYVMSAFAVGCFAGSYLYLVPLAIVALPKVLEILLRVVKDISNRIRLRYIIKHVARCVIFGIESLATMPFYAVNNLIISLKMIVKLVKKENLLDWKPFAVSQKTNGSVLVELSLFAVASFVVCVAIWLMGGNVIASGVYFAVSFVCLQIENNSGKGTAKQNKHTEKLMKYAERTFAYFKFMRNKNGLIADNLQIKPYIGMSETTSPTNIGFQLIGELCGCILEMQSEQEFIATTSQILDMVCKLPKWQGNLYNWYNVSNCEIAQDTVSSVDSGNFLACLMVLEEIYKEIGQKTLAEKCENIIQSTNLQSLYDEKRGLFYISYDQKSNKFEGHYDMLASESRMLAYVYCALNGDSSTWFNLNRDCVRNYGNTLASWSGTMFEYLMPEIFLKSPQGSLLNNTAKNVVKMQIKKRKKGVFGVSECGYYSFDNNLKYQYHAYGLEELALNSQPEKMVFSPYSSIIALQYGKDKCILDNLKKFENLNAYNEFGFNEAVDMVGKTKVIQSYMTHHQGMIISALTNAICNDKISGLFMNRAENIALSLVLSEQGFESVNDVKNHEKTNKNQENISMYYENKAKIEYYKYAKLVHSDDVLMYSDCFGRGYMTYRGNIINRYTSADDKSNRILVFYNDDNSFELFDSIISCSNNAIFNPFDVGFSFGLSNYGALFEARLDNSNYCEIDSIFMPKCHNAHRVFYLERLAMSKYNTQNAHPIFNNMFVVTEFLPELNAVIATSNAVFGDDKFFVGFIVKNASNLNFETNLYNLSYNGSLLSYDEIASRFSGKNFPYCSFGEVLEPCFAFYAEPEYLDKPIRILKCFAKSRDGLLEQIRYFNMFSDVKTCQGDCNDADLLCELTVALYSRMESQPAYPNDALEYIDRFGLVDDFSLATGWKYVILYRFSSGSADMHVFKSVLTAVKQLTMFGKSLYLWVLFDGVTDSIDIDYLCSIIKAYEIDDFRLFTQENIGELDKFAYITLDRDLKIIKEPLSFAFPEESEKSRTNCRNYRYDLKAVEEELGKFLFTSGKGEVCENGYHIDKFKQKSLLPYSVVFAAVDGGFVATENGGGYIFGKNSHENRYTKFHNDPTNDRCFEGVFCEFGGVERRINGGDVCSDVTMCNNSISYYSNIEGMNIEVISYVNENGVKINKVNIHESKNNLKLKYRVCAVCGCEDAPRFVYSRKGCDSIIFKNLQNGCGFVVKFLCENGGRIKIETVTKGNYCGEIIVSVTSDEKRNFSGCFCVGSYENIDKIEYYEITKEAKNHQKPSKITIKSACPGFDEFFNHSLIPQVINSRLNGKCGYYQIGGATGFRDQLQDVLCLLQIEPNRVRNQILLHAKHQYLEGDVMHWWHEPNFGLRTHIADDRLFLPFLVAEYLETTGDLDILQENVPYVSGLPLHQNEVSRFECAQFTDFEEDLYIHCVNALDKTCNFGVHGLVLMYGGDWNDGMDYICSKGIGESIPLSEFLVWTIEKFMPYFSEKDAEKFSIISKNLKFAINAFSFDGMQYIRLFGDDGIAYGSRFCETFDIDLLSQCFAVLSGVAIGENAEKCLHSAQKLVDHDLKIVRLLEPPLTDKTYLGYISKYPKGVRENGGQYTHAAVWYAMALLEAGFVEDGTQILEYLNPLERCRDKDLAELYGGEPYAMPADIYYGENAGRMGWSFYTGSASWYYKLVLEVFFGIKKRKNRLYIQPKLTQKYSGTVMKYCYEDAVYNIKFTVGNEYVLIENGIKRCDKQYIELERGADKGIEVIFTVESRRIKG